MNYLGGKSELLGREEIIIWVGRGCMGGCVWEGSVIYNRACMPLTYCTVESTIILPIQPLVYNMLEQLVNNLNNLCVLMMNWGG